MLELACLQMISVTKSKPHFIEKRDMKRFSSQGFTHDRFHFDWDRIEFIDDDETAWKYFNNGFLQLINKHAPMQKYRVKGQAQRWRLTGFISDS